jgi:hypothetical protein
MEDSEVTIAPEVYEEILHNTDRKNYLNVNERILRKSMVALVKSGHASFLFLRDDESRDWWAKTVKVAAATIEKRKEAWRVYEIKQRAWDRLSEDDRKILKIRKPTMPKDVKPNG